MLVLLALVALQPGMFPELTDGVEVRLVSRDLLTVHGNGRVENGVLRLEGALEPGAELRLLVFASESALGEDGEAPAEEGEAREEDEDDEASEEGDDGADGEEAGGWWVRVTPDGRDLLFREPGAAPSEARSLRAYLREVHGITLELVEDTDR